MSETLFSGTVMLVLFLGLLLVVILFLMYLSDSLQVAGDTFSWAVVRS